MLIGDRNVLFSQHRNEYMPLKLALHIKMLLKKSHKFNKHDK